MRFKDIYRRSPKLFFTSILLQAALLFHSPAHAADDLSKEYKLKAAYLLNFTRFIEWQNPGTAEHPATVRICVDGGSEFIGFLANLVRDRRVGALRHPVAVSSLDAAIGCDLIYVRKAKTMEDITFSDAIIVADSCAVPCPHAAISFYIDNRKVRFEIDLEKMHALNVAVSSELLKLARIKHS